MQLWEVLKMSPGDVDDKAHYYIERMEASGAAVAAAAMVCLQPDVRFGYGPLQPTKEQARVLKCTCAHARCHKVLRCGTLVEAMRGKRSDPLACPADPNGTCCTRSGHVAAFYFTLEQVMADSMYVWDWIDVPGCDGMHFDSTVIPMTGAICALRFEIDGRRHFRAHTRKRQDVDWAKDDAVNELRVPLLRLHWQDEAKWGQFIRRFVMQPGQTVVYSASYKVYLQHQPELHNVWDWGV
jgi:hypothetical protein